MVNSLAGNGDVGFAATKRSAFSVRRNSKSKDRHRLVVEPFAGEFDLSYSWCKRQPSFQTSVIAVE
jgi:hypothetical protein